MSWVSGAVTLTSPRAMLREEFKPSRRAGGGRGVFTFPMVESRSELRRNAKPSGKRKLILNTDLMVSLCDISKSGHLLYIINSKGGGGGLSWLLGEMKKINKVTFVPCRVSVEVGLR